MIPVPVTEIGGINLCSVGYTNWTSTHLGRDPEISGLAIRVPFAPAMTGRSFKVAVSHPAEYPTPAYTSDLDAIINLESAPISTYGRPHRESMNIAYEYLTVQANDVSSTRVLVNSSQPAVSSFQPYTYPWEEHSTVNVETVLFFTMNGFFKMPVENITMHVCVVD